MKKYVFDFDGTLVDSMPAWVNTMLTILEENSITYPDNIVKIITPLGYRGTAEYFRNELKLDIPVEVLIERMNELAYEAYAYNVVAKDTVAETLKKLKEMGHSINVLTASPHLTLDICLKRNGIYDLFDNVWSCDDFNTTKSDPEIYHRTAERLGTTVSDCVFLDDNFNALSTAKSAGMEVIGVYDKSSDEYVDEITGLCGRYIYKFSELL